MHLSFAEYSSQKYKTKLSKITIAVKVAYLQTLCVILPIRGVFQRYQNHMVNFVEGVYP